MPAGSPVLLKIYDVLAGNYVMAEASYGMVKTVGADHARVHEGVHFHSGELVDPVAAQGRLSYALQVGSYTVHLRAYNFTSTAGPCTIGLYEAPFLDASSLGVALAPVNLSRPASSTTATAGLRRNPFVDASSLGTLLDATLIEGSSGGPIRAVGGGAGAPVVEWVLSKQTDYLLTLVNSSGSGAAVASKISWYEPGRT